MKSTTARRRIGSRGARLRAVSAVLTCALLFAPTPFAAIWGAVEGCGGCCGKTGRCDTPQHLKAPSCCEPLSPPPASRAEAPAVERSPERPQADSTVCAPRSGSSAAFVSECRPRAAVDGSTVALFRLHASLLI